MLWTFNCRHVELHCSIVHFRKSFKTVEFSTYICSISGTKFVLIQSNCFNLWKATSSAASLWREPRATPWLCLLRLSHTPLNLDYKHYRLCSSGLSQTETHILLECGLTRAPRQVMLNSLRNIILKEQVFSLSQLNRLSQAAWKRILLFGHAELNRPSILQLYDAACDFLATALTYL